MSNVPATVRRFWLVLWFLAIGMVLLLLFATLAPRPIDPEALRFFSRDVLETGRRFSREARMMGALRSLAVLSALLCLSLHPLGARLLRRLEEVARGRFYVGLALVAAGITLVLAAVELPFSFYLSYVHEKAYGLTKQTPWEWFREFSFSQGLRYGLTLFGWVPVYACIRRWPRFWWFPAGALNLALSVALATLAPVLLLPMEGKLVPIRDPATAALVQRVADQAGVQVETVQELVVSHKSERVNAMVIGLGPTRRVVLYDTLLQQFKPEEIAVVMAHELAHAANRDVLGGLLLGAGLEALALFAAAAVLRAMVGTPPLGLPAPYFARGLALMLLLSSLASTLTSPVQNIASRRAEVRADLFALEVTGNPRAFIRTFQKLAAGNPGDVDPPALVEWMAHSHPSIMNRIRAAGEFTK